MDNYYTPYWGIAYDFYLQTLVPEMGPPFPYYASRVWTTYGVYDT